MNLTDLKLSPDVHAQLSGVAQMVSSATPAPVLLTGVGAAAAAAGVAAHAGRPLYHVDLSTIVSQYVGETEKNLDQAFAAAEAQGAILFFDEADALLGKRSEVKDSHDRYANFEMSYLLQRIEQYQGAVIVVTNSDPDPALNQIFRNVVRFPHKPWP